MKIKIILVLFFAGLYACSGPKDFLSPNFRKKGREHKTLAVLPFQVNNMGKAPASLTADQLAKIEEDEAKAFQQSLYNNLTNNLGPSRLQVQTVNKTNNLLREKGVKITAVADRNPEDLAKLLGVDAVVFASVTKYRYLDEKASMGIDAGKQVLGAVTKGASDRYTSGVNSKTNDINVTCSLIDQKDGEVLWKINNDESADWRKTPNVVVDDLNKKLAKRFPYKYL